MKDLAIALRAAQLFAHNAHNSTTGCTFFSDHEFFGESYGAYEDAYDGVIERCIGLSIDIDLCEITLAAAKAACKGVSAVSLTDSINDFNSLYAMEKAICACVDDAISGTSNGTQNFLQGIADNSEMRQYKICQRLKNVEGAKKSDALTMARKRAAAAISSNDSYEE